jgi:putative FmdB family regulatory protein
MPIYEYECPKCGRFDALQKMSEPALETHELCGSKVRKLMSASAFSFKGSGFYATDYGGKSAACISAGDKGEKAPEKKSEACATCPANKAA